MDENVKEACKELHQRLYLALFTGSIERPAYNVGMQLLWTMVMYKTTNFAFSWKEISMHRVMQKGRIVADVAPSTHFDLYGALQQLQQRVGLITNITQAALQDDVREYKETGECWNFTGAPDVDSYVVMPNTPIFCQYESFVGKALEQRVQSFIDGHPKGNVLPAWLKSGVA